MSDWILLEKEPPKAGSLVLVSLRLKSVDTRFKDVDTIDIAYFDGEKWRIDCHILDDREEAMLVAWMPAPEPYKEEKSDYEKIVEDINKFMNQAKEKKRKVMSVECGGKTYIFSLADVVKAPDGEPQYKWKLESDDGKNA